MFIAIKQHPKYPLVICANRDEFYQRPTRPAHKWQKAHNDIVAGKDLEASGSWLGINPQGYFCAVTNFRKGKAVAKHSKSRGKLVTQFLVEEFTNIEKFKQYLVENSDDYGPFNLVFGNATKLYCYSSENKKTQILEPGFHAVSNGFIDDHWPKMSSGIIQLQDRIKQSSEETDIDSMLEILKDDTQASDDSLPDTGISYKWEKLLSSIFIAGDNYGTRASTVLLQNSAQRSIFVEQTYHQSGKKGERVELLV
ncbi:MAG: NRDE family protein [Kangiellaceae bacterium]|nr:NRDE family protein [Kangiellaceae bacterium]